MNQDQKVWNVIVISNLVMNNYVGNHNVVSFDSKDKADAYSQAVYDNGMSSAFVVGDDADYDNWVAANSIQ